MLTAHKTGSGLRALLMAALLIVARPIPAYAADSNPKDVTLQGFPAGVGLTDTMDVNAGTIGTLYNGGIVKDNTGTITHSSGTVLENHGSIEFLEAGHAGTNYGTISKIVNTGSLGVNDEEGEILVVGMGNEIERNYGTIQESGGVIAGNYGTIGSNTGSVTMYDGRIGENSNGGTVKFEAKVVGGETVPAKGTIGSNKGKVEIGSGTVTIEENTGDIEISDAAVTVEKNSGNITLGRNAVLICGENTSGGVITKTSKSADIICPTNNGTIRDETAVLWKIVFVGDDGQAKVTICDDEADGVYFTLYEGAVFFTLPPEYGCKDALQREEGDVNTWALNAYPEEGDTEFAIVCHKCSADGYGKDADKHWKECTECRRIFAEEAHAADTYISDGNSTCIKDGTESGSCAVCGYSHTRVAADSHLTSDHHEHVVIDERVEPTETSAGLTEGSHCEDCHQVLTAQEIIPKLPHTCVSSSDYLYDGSTHWKICSVCNDKFDEGAHTYNSLVLNQPATCTESATYYPQCDCCGAVDRSRTVPVGDPLGHSFKNYVSNHDATCTADGTKTSVCANGCGATDTVTDPGTRTGHRFTAYVSNRNATCTADSTRTAVCANGCGATDTVTDPGTRTGHRYGAWTSVDDTQHRRVCSNNAAHTETENHKYTEWTTTRKPTETQTGSEERSCSVCAHKETRVLPVLKLANYGVISGADIDWTGGGTAGIRITTDAPFDEFVVKVDGSTVDPADYTVESGCVGITLAPAYLETLSIGSHSVEIVSDEGRASTIFTIKAAEHTVAFRMNGHGDPVRAQTITKGEKAVMPAEPAAEGYSFSGWYADAAFSAEFDFDAPITADTTVYAKWAEAPAAPTASPLPADPADREPDESRSILPWAALLLAVGGALAGTAVYVRKRKSAE